MYILGISAFYHDAAACLIYKNNIIAAAQEERFTRIKNDSSFPSNAIKYCLSEAKITGKDLSNVVFYEKPFLKFERIIESYLSSSPKGFRSFAYFMPSWIKNKLFQKNIIINEINKIFGKGILQRDKILFSEHHLSHAASAFYPSPFKEAAVLTIDGVGEWGTTSLYLGKNNSLKLIKKINFPHSLGLFYSSFTYYIGFKVNSGEYKLMGLAPYGKPRFVDLIKNNLIKIKKDGSFSINMKYFDFLTGFKMINKKFEKLFGMETRKTESSINQKHMDIAASIQLVIEEILFKMANNIFNETGQKNLCLAGGVALNCVANGKLIKKKLFEDIWVQPASGDAGGALGAALAVWYMKYNNNREALGDKDSMNGSLLGPSYKSKDIENELNSFKATFHKTDKRELLGIIVSELIKQKSIGLMQGRMEFGPRALGCRSIIADPRSSEMQKKLNLKIKFRESFRPFAPSILYDEVSKWFDFYKESPYMSYVTNIKTDKKISLSGKERSLEGLDQLHIKRSTIPAVTHVDYSARLQTVTKENNKMFYEILKEFFNQTNCPVLVNTSFNVRGEPIVCSPKDAYKCFMNTNLDILIIEDYLLYKDEQKDIN